MHAIAHSMRLQDTFKTAAIYADISDEKVRLVERYTRNDSEI